MKCPYCGFQESKVVDSRHSEDNLSIRRRRECLGCQRRFIDPSCLSGFVEHTGHVVRAGWRFSEIDKGYDQTVPLSWHIAMYLQFVIAMVCGKPKKKALRRGYTELYAHVVISVPIAGHLGVEFLNGYFGSRFCALAIELDFVYLCL